MFSYIPVGFIHYTVNDLAFIGNINPNITLRCTQM